MLVEKNKIKHMKTDAKSKNTEFKHMKTDAKPNKAKAKRMKKESDKKIVFVQCALIIVLIISGIEIFKWVKDHNRNVYVMKDISDVVKVVDQSDEQENTTVTKYEIDFKKLKEKNSDCVAWIKVNNTQIEYPIVKTDNNEFYLTHNLEKKSNKAGWLFMDYENKLDGTDKNIIVYGHNMKDDSMFGSLANTLKEEWYNNEENQYITFITENEYSKYQVFSVYEIESEDYYIQTNFKSGEFAKFVKKLKQRSKKDFWIDVTENDQILTLSTCSNNNKYRVVLHAKKITEDLE